MISRKVILIDNYDSFTWNLYQYLCEEGADVEVFRNDKITVEQVEALKPDILLISPGPGHPRTDSGISRDCIKHFTGKIPVFGVCMGQQCMFDVFGGEVAYAGEIVHGKTSPVHHDNKGLFKGVPQGVSVTRYHSLAGSEATLPDVLEISARLENGIIMGVRHQKYTVEGVQFHPESILTEEGHLMIRNMLRVTGGTWEENDCGENAAVAIKMGGGSILDRIYAQRRKDVDHQSNIAGFTNRDLQANFDLGLAPPLQDFYQKLTSCKGKAAVLAEIKRASPSKGDICPDAISAQQALRYAKSGASTISVLTEPHWFKGHLQDLVNVRRALDVEFHTKPTERPCVLRKEFVFCKYQILEARLAGADTVLLIVKMLPQEKLIELYQYATLEMGFEPLVEVSSKSEMDRALQLGAKVIGVNNRDLHSFAVDLNTTSNLVSAVPKNILLIALSGITTSKDAEKYKKEGVHGFLVGEALMRSANPSTFIRELSA
ncbi:TRP3 (YKL211C) [Zygosaccharomyces parabailii]|nr:TRP3 (YKL211C) [Zygosaccharomyces parabailii]CDH13242.1 probable Anthranilate synthase component 2 [Zygosaccharomyces bailii ISA1307]